MGIASLIAERAFQLVYQPIVELDTGTTSGVEALCRFADGRSPIRWFDEAEAEGMATELDLAIVETVLQEVRRLPAGFVALNVSPATVLEPELARLLRAPDVPTERLVIEITEHAPIANYGKTRQVVDALRDDGVQLAVDDAGAGYATLRHVLRLRPDIIKIDMSITQHIDDDPARLALITAMVIFAGEIGAEVVAEGVETESELEALRAAGVNRAQGFALARPQSPPIRVPAFDNAGDGVVGAYPAPVETAPARPPWAEHDQPTAAATAHALLSPVGGIDLALDLLRRKSQNLGEDEMLALIGAAQRQVRLVGGALHDLIQGRPPGPLIYVDDITRPDPEPLQSAAQD